MGRPRTQPETCTVSDCEIRPYARGFCVKHFRRWERSGSTELTRRPPSTPTAPRECSRCHESKPPTDFSSNGRGGIMGACRDCRAEAARTRRRDRPDRAEFLLARRAKIYGLTAAEVHDLMVAADHRCQVCGSDERLAIDHDHDSGVVRGILCGVCNTGIGMLGDDPERLIAAANYLRGVVASTTEGS